MQQEFAREFEPYGPSYWGAIAVFVLGAALLVWAGRSRTAAQSNRVSRILGGLTAVIYAAILIYNLMPPTLAGSVPLQLTDLATVVAAIALWTRRQWAFALTYYWGLVLSVQALISPVLRGPDFPDYRFLAFYAIHLLVVWAAIYLTWGLGMRPDWRDFRLAVLVTSVWAAVTVVFNRIAGTNYGFTNYKPNTKSVLDLLGPWPVYIVVTAALVFFVWALMTWPWVRRQATPR
ncbi:TIGR02206 family membrane protein [Mycolicibacterium sp. GF69]|nr:TIGR02206 family membrane protein [Mycolicibacterium sp. GF69]